MSKNLVKIMSETLVNTEKDEEGGEFFFRLVRGRYY